MQMLLLVLAALMGGSKQGDMTLELLVPGRRQGRSTSEKHNTLPQHGQPHKRGMHTWYPTPRPACTWERTESGSKQDWWETTELSSLPGECMHACSQGDNFTYDGT